MTENDEIILQHKEDDLLAEERIAVLDATDESFDADNKAEMINHGTEKKETSAFTALVTDYNDDDTTANPMIVAERDTDVVIEEDIVLDATQNESNVQCEMGVF